MAEFGQSALEGAYRGESSAMNRANTRENMLTGAVNRRRASGSLANLSQNAMRQGVQDREREIANNELIKMQQAKDGAVAEAQQSDADRQRTTRVRAYENELLHQARNPQRDMSTTVNDGNADWNRAQAQRENIAAVRKDERMKSPADWGRLKSNGVLELIQGATSGADMKSVVDKYNATKGDAGDKIDSYELSPSGALILKRGEELESVSPVAIESALGYQGRQDAGRQAGALEQQKMQNKIDVAVANKTGVRPGEAQAGQMGGGDMQSLNSAVNILSDDEFKRLDTESGALMDKGMDKQQAIMQVFGNIGQEAFKRTQDEYNKQVTGFWGKDTGLGGYDDETIKAIDEYNKMRTVFGMEPVVENTSGINQYPESTDKPRILGASRQPKETGTVKTAKPAEQGQDGTSEPITTVKDQHTKIKNFNNSVDQALKEDKAEIESKWSGKLRQLDRSKGTMDPKEYQERRSALIKIKREGEKSIAEYAKKAAKSKSLELKGVLKQLRDGGFYTEAKELQDKYK